MSNDLSFQIQLGLILPKLQTQIAGNVTEIVTELVNIVKAGMVDAEELSLSAIKELFMQDLGIFLDKTILPEIEAKFVPAAVEDVTAAEAEAN